MPEEEVPTGSDVGRDALNARLRLFAAEVHQDVAAEDYDGVRTDRLGFVEGQVVMDDAHHPSNRWNDFIPAAGRREIPPPALARQTLDLGLGVDGFLGSCERVERHIAGDDLPAAAPGFIQEHRQAVGFLAVAAPGAPHDASLARFLAHEGCESVELSRVAKESAVLDGDAIQQVFEGGGLSVQDSHVRVHRDARDPRALLKQSREPGLAGRLGFETGSRPQERSGEIERGHCGLAVVASVPRSGARPRAPLRVGGVGLPVLPSSRETALRSPASSKEVLTI